MIRLVAHGHTALYFANFSHEILNLILIIHLYVHVPRVRHIHNTTPTAAR